MFAVCSRPVPDGEESVAPQAAPDAIVASAETAMRRASARRRAVVVSGVEEAGRARFTSEKLAGVQA